MGIIKRLFCDYLVIFILVYPGSEAQLTISGTNIYHIPFIDGRKSIVKNAYLAYTGHSSDLTIRCESPSERGFKPSLFKGPWSNLTHLVDRGVLLVSNANITINEQLSGFTLTFSDIQPDHSGTYYCFTSEVLTDRQIIARSYFVELFVRANTSMFCYIHSFTDSIFWSGLSKAFLQCVATRDDLSHDNVGAQLISSNQVSTELSQWASSPSSLSTPVGLAEIIYEIPFSGSDVQLLNNSVVSCTVSSVPGFCDNIESFRLFDDLMVYIIPSENYLTRTDTGTQILFLCWAIPKVTGSVTWTLSYEDGSDVDAVSMNVSMTTEGSKLTLDNFNVSRVGTVYNVTVLCTVRYGGKRTTQTAKLIVTDHLTTTGLPSNQDTEAQRSTKQITYQSTFGVTKPGWKTTRDLYSVRTTRYLHDNSWQTDSGKSASCAVKPWRIVMMFSYVLLLTLSCKEGALNDIYESGVWA